MDDKQIKQLLEIIYKGNQALATLQKMKILKVEEDGTMTYQAGTSDLEMAQKYLSSLPIIKRVRVNPPKSIPEPDISNKLKLK